MAVVGWDIGGVNTKVALVSGSRVLSVHSRAYEIQWAPEALTPLLTELAANVGVQAGDIHAVTMTAELSQLFPTKREGVAHVVNAAVAAFPGTEVLIYTVDGRFIEPGAAKQEPLLVAAANWAATAFSVARCYPQAVLIDIGTTTTDIIPVMDGVPTPLGRTDPARLASGELVYTGAVRTPVEGIASHVAVHGVLTGIAAEGFALSGDVHVWRGTLLPSDYSVEPPDRRPRTREFAGGRLARAICADRDMLDDAAITSLADGLAAAQARRITEAIAQVVGRHPAIRTAVITGLGAFLAEAAARDAGLEVVHLGDSIGIDAARCAPAAAVALLLEQARNTATA